MLIVSTEFSIPDGYRFRPTQEEILSYYLKPAINGEPLSSGILIECDVYGENREPWKIFDKHAKESFWVFTKLKKKSKLRIDRTAGRGCWLGRSTKEIKTASGQLLGFDKYFTFTCKKDDMSSQGNGHWVMHEFSLRDEGLSDYVVCEIKNKDVAVGLDHQEDEVEAKNKNKNKKRKFLEVYDEEISVPSTKKVCGDQQRSLNESESVQTMASTSANHQESQDPNRVQTMTSYSAPDFADYICLEELKDDFSDIFVDVDALMNGLDFEEFISFN
ncbi:hypothetical protein CRYUN_Cryun36dG0016700 [Craigia yunnanensis]